jgi:predicted AlkP superfamily pyrophosphatase or phosphodiesterase
MKKKFTLILVAFLLTFSCFAQNKKLERPKLVIGIVVDQMRYDYLYRYYDKYAENGAFKRLMNEGFNVKNTHYNYVPTFTAPGHTSIYTGTTPAYHGIISNTWYDKVSKKEVYCVTDSSYTTVGTNTTHGKRSPHRMQVNTITDQLRLATQFKSKTIGISIKDRASVLPAGHTANAAYWYDIDEGKYISSSFYMDKLPDWVKKFNDRKLPDEYLTKKWETLLPIEEYTESREDDSPYEKPVIKGEKYHFPYDLSKFDKKTKYEKLRATPFGNSLVIEMCKAAVLAEKMGQGEATDFLAMSFSSPDMIGHNQGPHSVEVEDTYLRLDRELGAFLDFLDKEIGKGEYLVFLSADHAAAKNPLYLQSKKLPTDFMLAIPCLNGLIGHLNTKYGEKKWIEHISSSSGSIFLNHKLIREEKQSLTEMQQDIADFVLSCDGVFKAYTAKDLQTQNYSEDLVASGMQKGYNQKRSGDIFFAFNPGWIPLNADKSTKKAKSKGTTHGSIFTYDTHVPLLWYGWHIPKGESVKRANITDIAPTLSFLLNIALPNACTGQPIEAIFNQKKIQIVID